MTENLQKAYDAYQQALVHLNDPKVCPQGCQTRGNVLIAR